jgi:hypothetical protein
MLYFTHVSGGGGISAEENVNIFVLFREVDEIINRAKFSVDQFHCFEVTGVQIWGFPLERRMTLTHWIALCTDLPCGRVRMCLSPRAK